MVSLWEALQILAPIIAPVISIALIVVGRIIWNHETRIRQNEKSRVRHSRTLYGDDDDKQQAGISSDVRELSKKVDDIQNDLQTIKRMVDTE